MAVPEDEFSDLGNPELENMDLPGNDPLDAAGDAGGLADAPKKKKGLLGRGKGKKGKEKPKKEPKAKKARKEKAPKAKKEKKPKKEKAAKKKAPKVKQSGGGLAALLNIYTVLLAIALGALVVAVLGMVLELQRYDWDRNADAAKRIVMAAPTHGDIMLADCSTEFPSSDTIV